MELVKIERLLEKYFEATTTEAEERDLRRYFEGDGVAPHLEQYQPMFRYFSSAREERFTGKVPLKPRKYQYRWLSIAAAIVLLFGLYLGNDYQEQKQAEYAYAQTRQALSLLAQNLDRGTDKMIYLNEFEQATQKIYNNN